MKNLTMERGIGFHKRPHKPQEKREREKMHLFVFVECGKVGYRAHLHRNTIPVFIHSC
jgi:hypothetical protein